MIAMDLPEPPEKDRTCNSCGRAGCRGLLIHWPHAGYRDPTWQNVLGGTFDAFSFWYYECRWCRGWKTRKRMS